MSLFQKRRHQLQLPELKGILTRSMSMMPWKFSVSSNQPWTLSRKNNMRTWMCSIWSNILRRSTKSKQGMKGLMLPVTTTLLQTKLSEGTNVGPHILKMIGYVENLEWLGVPIEWELAIDLILQSLSENFSHFVMNLLMNEIDKFLPQHVSMLRTVERNMNKGKEKTIITVNNGKFKKKLRKRNKFKGNGKGKVVSKPSIKSLNHVERMVKKLGNFFY